MCPGFDSRTRHHMWVEFVVGSLLCSERFFSGFSSFPLSSKTNISKFQFDSDVGHFSHEPLARVIAQALPVLDVKFHLHLQVKFLFYLKFKVSIKKTFLKSISVRLVTISITI